MRHTVLLVDDDPDVLDGLRRGLRREPYEIRIAPSSEEALRTLVTHDVDLVVSDHHMPGTLGTELLERIRQHRPDTIRILLTGCQDFEVAMHAVNHGEVYRVFSKPCPTSELARAIREAFKQKELRLQTVRLLETVKRQARMLDEWEEAFPGLTRVSRDAEGCIVVPEDSSMELEDLMRKIEAELARAEKRLAPSR